MSCTKQRDAVCSWRLIIDLEVKEELFERRNWDIDILWRKKLKLKATIFQEAEAKCIRVEFVEMLLRVKC